MSEANAARTGWLDATVAAAGGLLWAYCFERVEHPLVPWVALAPLVWLLSRPRAVRLGLLHGTVGWLAAIPWIVPTLVTYGSIPFPLALLLFTGLALYLGAYHAAFAWLGRGALARGGPLALLALPALWCVLEVVRTRLFSGFPWNLAGTAWIAVPGALPLAAWGGVLGVSFLAVFANTGFAHALVHRRWEWAAATTLAALLLLGIAIRFAAPGPAPAATVPARILQPATPILDPGARDRIASAYATILDLSDQACDRDGALVIWPESAGWPRVLERDGELRSDLLRLAARGCGVLLNSPRFTEREVYNTAFLMAPGGAVSYYDKRHLVPFGEYVPLGELLPFVQALARNAGGFAASDELRLLHFGPASLGLAVCFEITFPGEVTALVREGATALVTLTNDAWYGDTAAPWQHLRAARFRAAENHRTVLRAALTGVSAWIEPDGSLRSSIGVDQMGILRGELAPRSERTPYSRAPWAVPLICLALLLAVPVERALRSRRALRGAFPAAILTLAPERAAVGHPATTTAAPPLHDPSSPPPWNPRS